MRSYILYIRYCWSTVVTVPGITFFWYKNYVESTQVVLSFSDGLFGTVRHRFVFSSQNVPCVVLALAIDNVQRTRYFYCIILLHEQF
jgi:hypothetical protein